MWSRQRQMMASMHGIISMAEVGRRTRGEFASARDCHHVVKRRSRADDRRTENRPAVPHSARARRTVVGAHPKGADRLAQSGVVVWCFFLLSSGRPRIYISGGNLGELATDLAPRHRVGVGHDDRRGRDGEMAAPRNGMARSPGVGRHRFSAGRRIGHGDRKTIARPAHRHDFGGRKPRQRRLGLGAVSCSGCGSHWKRLRLGSDAAAIRVCHHRGSRHRVAREYGCSMGYVRGT